MRPSELAMKIEAPPMHNQIIEDMRYSHLTKREREADIQPIRTEPKIQRNSLCSCGSGKKYKKCCGK
jgi:preprotein translocase subunit SecA